MKAAERHKQTLIEYIADPDNEFPTRREMALDVIKYKDTSTLYKRFTPEELTEIEIEGLAMRRKRYTRDLSVIDRQVISQAQDGDLVAADMAYNRFEGSVPQHLKHQNPDGTPLNPLAGGIRLTFVKKEVKEVGR